MKKRNIIKLFGEITQETVNKIYEQVLEILEKNEISGITPVFILINSLDDEDCKNAIAIRNCLKLIPNKLIGAVIGFSGDATNIIFLDCDKKYASPDSIFYFFSNLDTFSENFKHLKNHDLIISHLNENYPYSCKKDEIFESGLAEYKLTSFEQLFKTEQ